MASMAERISVPRLRSQPTGRLIVTFARGTESAAMRSTLSKVAGTSRDASSFADEGVEAALLQGDAIHIEGLPVAVLGSNTDLAQAMAALESEGAVRASRPEFYMFPILDPPFADTETLTWGLRATAVPASAFTGRGIRVAVLDTGFDLLHPDFIGRAVPITTRSFVPNETAADGNGHGTHCAGTIAGPAAPARSPRYGVAPDVELFIGKVLSNAGSGREADILAAMAWAVRERCVVISMSLGRSVGEGETHTPDYEEAAQFALDNDCLVIAAAGNESRRQFGFVAPVGSPANSPSIMAVAAVGPALTVSAFSCGDVNGGGGTVDLAAPGEAVWSAAPLPRKYRTLDGTSMACPHVAGIAALHAEASGLRGAALREALVVGATALGDPVTDVGAGLVQAP